MFGVLSFQQIVLNVHSIQPIYEMNDKFVFITRSLLTDVLSTTQSYKDIKWMTENSSHKEVYI